MKRRTPKRYYSHYKKEAKKLGAKGSMIIRTSTVYTAEWVRLKCQFGCSEYGHRLTCPPYSPPPELTKKMLAEYKYGLLIHSNEWTDIRKIVYILERETFLDGYHKAFGMSSGPCDLCKRCPKYCRFPDKARPSMEACGIDVYKTVRKNGFPIEVLRTEECEGNYYGLVLIE